MYNSLCTYRLQVHFYESSLVVLLETEITSPLDCLCICFICSDFHPAHAPTTPPILKGHYIAKGVYQHVLWVQAKETEN